MIAELHGKITDRREESLVVLVDGTGIGLEVIVPARSLADPGEGIHLFTSLHIANDGPLLTGFESPEELRVFNALLNVNGVGPRMAVRVLSTHPASRIYEALDQEDPKPFQAVSGIGLARPTASSWNSAASLSLKTRPQPKRTMRKAPGKSWKPCSASVTPVPKPPSPSIRPSANPCPSKPALRPLCVTSAPEAGPHDRARRRR